MPFERISGEISFSDHFEIDRNTLESLGAFDPLLDVDLPYAIDPKLLEHSEAPEMEAAHAILLSRYRDIYLLLSASENAGDRPWREAYQLVDFPEFRGACLGFSSGNAAGHGWGPHMRRQVLASAKEVIRLGITDSRFFELIGVFEEGIGPDLISDMIGTILIDPLTAYTKRVCEALNVPMQSFRIRGRDYELPGYLAQRTNTERYIILIPEDVLSEMPVALDRSGVAAIAEQNDEARRYLNATFGADWQALTKDRKSVTRVALLNESSVFEEFLKEYEHRPAEAYDFDVDPKNTRLWYTLARLFLEHSGVVRFPKPPAEPTAETVLEASNKIIAAFKRNVEHNGMYQLFYNDDDTPRKESIIQRTFQAIAQAYCNANNLDLAVEPNAGRGPVDFKISQGSVGRVIIEFKRSQSTRLLQGYQMQVAAYEAAESATAAIYVVMDFGTNNVKLSELLEVYENDRRDKKKQPILVIIEAWKHVSGSKA